MARSLRRAALPPLHQLPPLMTASTCSSTVTSASGRIARHRDKVAVAPSADRPEVRSAECLRLRCVVAAWIASSGVIPYWTMTRNCCGNHCVRHHPGVRAEIMRTPASCALRKLSRWIWPISRSLRMFSSSSPFLRAFSLGIVGVLDVHREPHRPLARLGQLDALVVEQAGMLDRVDARRGSRR